MMKLIDKEWVIPVIPFKTFALLLLLFLSNTSLFGQDSTKAYVNKAMIYQGYNLFQQYHATLVKELEDAERDNTARIRAIDSLYIASIVTDGETGALKSKYEADKERVTENQLDYVREILKQHDENVARCEANMKAVIEQIMKESGYATWEVIESGEQKIDGVDITAEVLLRLNK